MGSKRLIKIQKICRFLKVCLLIYLTAHWLSIAYLKMGESRYQAGEEHFTVFNQTYQSISDVPVFTFVMVVLANLSFATGFVAFYRLLGLYEQGVFFSERNVTLVKAISFLTIGYSMFGLLAGLVDGGGAKFALMIVVALTSPWVVVGGAVYVLAWAIDEGRKLQEEQALTV